MGRIYPFVLWKKVLKLEHTFCLVMYLNLVLWTNYFLMALGKNWGHRLKQKLEMTIF